MITIQKPETDLPAVVFSGELTFNDYKEMQGVLKYMSELSGPVPFFDMSNLTFVDSAGLGMLLLAHDVASKKQQPLVIKGASGQVRRTFDLAHFHKLFIFR